jgi:hypothetical protein
MCPTGYCQTKAASESSSAISSICWCKYGWSGEQCTVRIVSKHTIAVQAVLLIGTSFAMIPAVITSIKLGYVKHCTQHIAQHTCIH